MKHFPLTLHGLKPVQNLADCDLSDHGFFASKSKYPGAVQTITFTTAAGIGETVTPSVVKSGAAVMWDFGDGTTQTANSASHTYATVGTHDITLVIYDDPLFITQFSVYSDKIVGVLDVSALTSLTYLSCYNNQITTLDVSKLVNLVNINCNINKILSIDVKSSALKYLNCNSNLLEVLNIDYSSLLFISCQNNALLQAQIDKIVDDIWNNRDGFTSLYAHIGGTNLNPSGIYQNVCAPTTPLEKIYNLANAQCVGDTFTPQTWIY